MKDRPILFNGEMVRAILDGRKTQTRRAVKSSVDCSFHKQNDGRHFFHDGSGNGVHFESCPYGQPGDRLWVRETWADVNTCEGPAIAYRADGDAQTWREFSRTFGPDYGAGPSMDYESYPGNYCMWIDDLMNGEPDHSWRPSIHMPRWASRITLEITDVRVERLQDISATDAAKEGIGFQGCMGLPGDKGWLRMHFQQLWEDINGPDSWDANPWVWVIEFKRLES